MARWLGIDAGEGFHELVLLDETGKKARSRRVANRAESIEVALRDLVQSAGGAVEVILESRRSVGFVVTEVALQMGLGVWTAGTQALEEFRDLEGQPRKSDPRDAYLLARVGYLGLGMARPVLEIKAEEQELGRLARWRQVEKMIRYMLDKGDVWFARMEDIAAHVRACIDDGSYAPRVDDLPYYTERVCPVAVPDQAAE